MDYWIQEAVEEPGSYRASLKRRYGSKAFTKSGTIKQEYIARDAKRKGRIGKQARLAKTLRKMRK